MLVQFMIWRCFFSFGLLLFLVVAGGRGAGGGGGHGGRLTMNFCNHYLIGG